MEALKTVIKKNLDGAWSVNKINNKFHPLKVLIENNGYLKPFTKLGKKLLQDKCCQMRTLEMVFFIFFLLNL